MVTRALVRDDGQRRALLEPAQLAQPASRERLLDELHAEVAPAPGSSARASSGRPAGVGVDPDRAGVDARGPPRASRGRRAADLDLERREVAARGGPLRDDRRARRCRCVKSVGGISAGRPSSSWTGRPRPLADEVVQRDVERALRRRRCGAMRASIAPSAGRREPGRDGSASTDSLRPAAGRTAAIVAGVSP